MATEVAVTWHELKQIPAWTPVTSLPETPRHLTGVLFRVSATQYLICPPYNERFERAPDIPGFVAAALWASYEGAARRAVLMDLEADDVPLRPTPDAWPPTELLPFGVEPTYGAIVSELSRQPHASVLESAAYRVAKDGAFVHRSIMAALYTFFFRNRKEDDDDRCYAIEYRLHGGSGQTV